MFFEFGEAGVWRPKPTSCISQAAGMTICPRSSAMDCSPSGRSTSWPAMLIGTVVRGRCRVHRRGHSLAEEYLRVHAWPRSDVAPR